MSGTHSENSHSHLTSQLLRNSLLMILSRVAGIITLMISVPVILHYLGDEGFGVWESLLAIATVGVVIQAVISGTILWRISISHATQNHAETRRLVRVGVSCTYLLVLAATPTVWFWRQEIMDRIQLSAEWRSDAAWVLPLLVAFVILGGVNQSLLAVLNGYQKSGVAALVQSLGLAVTNLTAILILVLGGGLKSLLFAYLVGFLLMGLVLYPLASRLCQGISLCPILPNTRDLKLLGPFAGLVLLSNATFLFRDQADKLLLASLDSPLVTGQYGVAQRMAGLITQLCVVIYMPLTAAVGTQFAMGNWDGVRQLYVSTGTWMMTLVGLMGFLVCALHRSLFVLWLGHPQEESHLFLAMAVFGVVSAITFAGPGVALAKGIGRPGLETVYSVVTLVLIFVTKPLLIANFGTAASVFSSSISWCLASILFLHLLHLRADLPQIMLGRTYGIYLTTLAVSGLAWWGGSQVPHPPEGRGWAMLLLVVAVPLLTTFYLTLLASLGYLDLGHLTTRLRLRFRPPITRTEEYEANLPSISG